MFPTQHRQGWDMPMSHMMRPLSFHGEAACHENSHSFHVLPYPPSLHEPIDRHVSEAEVQRKASVNAAWWREFAALMDNSS
jgi:hypothetical protein